MKIIINDNSINIPWEKTAIKTNEHDSGTLFYQHLLTILSSYKDTPPVGELLQKYNNLPGTWLVVSPVNWQATHNNGLILAVGKELQLTDEEAKIVFTKLEHFFKEEGRKIFWQDKDTWLIEHIAAEPSLNSFPPEAVVQKRLIPYLQQLDTAGYWVRKITETQMLLKSCPANGIWIWGQGTLHTLTKQAVYTNDESLLKLLQVVGNNVHMLKDYKLPRNSTLVYDKITLEEINKLLPLINQFTIEWYWNNELFRTQPKSWWRKLIFW